MGIILFMKLAKLKRAEQHFEELKVEINSFLATNPYKVTSKLDTKTKKRIYYISSVRDIPENIALITGDIIQNLRSSLDHLAYMLYLLNSGDGDSGKHIYFPISKNATQYEIDKVRKTDGISDEARAKIDQILPYKGGNDKLWQINELNNIDKHRLLLTVGSSFRSMDLGEYMTASAKDAFPNLELPSIEAFFRPADTLFPLKKGDILFIDKENAKELPNMQFRFDISLNEPGVVEGEPLIELLASMLDATKSTIHNLGPLIPE